MAVGLFAVAEVMYAALYEGRVSESQNRLSKVHMTARDWKRSIPAWLRGTAIGAPFGCIPAGGTEIPTFLSYAAEKKLAKGEDLAEFGTKGAIEGVAGPEAANNATVTTALIPLLTLGIPTSNTTAILLGAFQNYGIQPGPQLFTNSAALVWALIASLYIGNVMLLILNLPMVGLWVKLLKIPKPQLYAGILIFATVGAYGMRQSAFDLVLLYGIGLFGVLMRRYDFPTAPVVVGMILGPLAEAQLRNAVSIGEGSAMVFLQRPDVGRDDRGHPGGADAAPAGPNPGPEKGGPLRVDTSRRSAELRYPVRRALASPWPKPFPAFTFAIQNRRNPHEQIHQAMARPGPCGRRAGCVAGGIGRQNAGRRQIEGPAGLRRAHRPGRILRGRLHGQVVGPGRGHVPRRGSRRAG